MKTEKIIYQLPDRAKVGETEKQIESVWMLSGRDFVREKTSYTTRYISDKEKIEIIPESKALSGHGANFIKKTKDYFAVKELPKKISDLKPYCEYFKPLSTYTEIENVVEIDINKAYWTAARNLGYLDESFYNLALSKKINKQSRMVALGVLGKRTYVSKFESPYQEIETTTDTAKTRPFWDNIVYTVGGVLEQTVNHYAVHVHGVWFDALFVDEKVSEPIRQFLLRRGYEASTKRIDSYIVEPRTGIVPGAKITRIFTGGEKKTMDVSYKQEQEMSFEEFLIMVLAES